MNNLPHCEGEVIFDHQKRLEGVGSPIAEIGSDYVTACGSRVWLKRSKGSSSVGSRVKIVQIYVCRHMMINHYPPRRLEGLALGATAIREYLRGQQVSQNFVHCPRILSVPNILSVPYFVHDPIQRNTSKTNHIAENCVYVIVWYFTSKKPKFH